MKHIRELVLSISCFLFAFLLTMMWVQQKDENLAADIAPSLLRFHVLANSNKSTDQALKLEVKSLLVQRIQDGLSPEAGKEETCTYIREHQAELETAAEAYMQKAGYDYPAKIELTRCYFPTKAYGDVVLPCGTYDAARVTLGSGRGRNWWCVLYPQLCFINASYGIVPDSSKLLLQHALEPEDYAALFRTRGEGIPIHIRFKVLDLLNLS
ncbi:MAG: stage II sporulation protein R [Hungatella sp.]